MNLLSEFLNNFDTERAVSMLIQVVAALLCISFHEAGHGLVAGMLGDPTAKNAGRVTMNPLRHVDILGLVLLITAGFGWAKPVPVNMHNFRSPKRDMALTALAGPASNFVMGAGALALGSILLHAAYWSGYSGGNAFSYVLIFLMRVALLSVGLGMFNLIPISPLDGSKILFSFLPDEMYYGILRYERYVMALLFALVFFGVLNTPLNAMLNVGLKALCALTRFPVSYFGL